MSALAPLAANVAALVTAVVDWAVAQTSIRGLALIGSHARHRQD
jgi:hypothetical protein